MFFISHRGNLQGSEPNRENTERQIVRCINLGFDVEIDIWYLNDTYWLGHDEPSYKTSRDFLFRHKEKTS